MRRHPALAHVRRTLIAALGLFGCDDPGDPVLDAEVRDAGPDRGMFGEACEGAVPIVLAGGEHTGYVRCPGGGVDRVGEALCDPVVAGAACEPPEGAVLGGSCRTDDDCVERPFGRCLNADNPGGDYLCGCAYGCERDYDCDDGQVCACPDGSGDSRCVEAPCAGPDDCETGRCGLWDRYPSCTRVQALACRTPADACEGDCGGDACAPPPGGTGVEPWQCVERFGECGRPLTVADGSRVAPRRARADWFEAATVRAVSPALARRLAARWAAIGAMEHASVGSFARFTLQLLGLGAPAELVAEAQQAAADEVVHARLAYGLASAYAGVAIGPGPMRVDDVEISTDRAEVVRALVVEGCVGETLGVVEALAGAEAVDPAVAAVCRQIAADELRHAALAWRTLGWLLGEDPALATVARAALREAIMAEVTQGADGTDGIAIDGIDGIDLGEHGFPGRAARRALRHRAVVEVIAPTAAALLG